MEQPIYTHSDMLRFGEYILSQTRVADFLSNPYWGEAVDKDLKARLCLVQDFDLVQFKKHDTSNN